MKDSHNKTLQYQLKFPLLKQQIHMQVEHNVQGDIRALLGKDCEVEQMMKFLKEIGKFEEI